MTIPRDRKRPSPHVVNRREREGEDRFDREVEPVNMSLAELQAWADKERKVNR